MKLIVGLGNPEREYKGTRHNVGFEVINKLAFDNNISVTKSKFRALIGEGFINRKKVILAKPQTYMNLSGESVIAIMQFYKIALSDIIIIYDEVSLNVGQIRVRERGSSGGHNGMKNIIQYVQSDEYIRIRVGVGGKPPKMNLADYVLSRFLKEEEQDIISGITKAGEAVTTILGEGVSTAMNKFNSINGKEA